MLNRAKGIFPSCNLITFFDVSMIRKLISISRAVKCVCDYFCTKMKKNTKNNKVVAIIRQPFIALCFLPSPHLEIKESKVHGDKYCLLLVGHLRLRMCGGRCPRN